MKKLLPLLALLVLLAHTAPALAQHGICPDETEQIPTMPGAWPGSMAVCDASGGKNDVNPFYDGDAPCGGGVEVRRAFIGEQPGVVIVPPAGQAFPSGQVGVTFYAHALNMLNEPMEAGAGFRIRSYNSAKQQIGEMVAGTGSAQLIWGNDPWWKYPRNAMLPINLPMEQGGYIHIQTNEQPAFASAFEISSLRIYDLGGSFPALCSIPGGLPDPTPTNTPTPTQTPTATDPPGGSPNDTPTPSLTPPNTPTVTNTPTIQPGFPTPTPVTSTPTRRPTMTPRPFNTLPAPFTPTPFPTISMPSLEMPSLQLPEIQPMDDGDDIEFSLELQPNATTESRLDALATQTAHGLEIATRWYTSTLGLSHLNTDITTTTGITTPLGIATQFTQYLTVPVSWVKAMQGFMPNLWPMILFLLLVTIWMFFIAIVKFFIAVASESMEIGRKLVELIPGM